MLTQGIGPHRAYELIKKHKSIEKVVLCLTCSMSICQVPLANYCVIFGTPKIESLDKKKYPVPDDFLYKESAKLFHSPGNVGVLGRK